MIIKNERNKSTHEYCLSKSRKKNTLHIRGEWGFQNFRLESSCTILVDFKKRKYEAEPAQNSKLW